MNRHSRNRVWRVTVSLLVLAGGLVAVERLGRPDATISEGLEAAGAPGGGKGRPDDPGGGNGNSRNPNRVPSGTGNLAEDIRMLLLRSYVPADGRLAIDADPPVITMVMRDPSTGATEDFTLPDCPARLTSDDLFTKLFNDTKSTTPEEHFGDMARDLGVDKFGDIGLGRNPFPYCSWWARINTKVYDSRDYTKQDDPVQDGMNIFLPDSDATYWAVPFNASELPNKDGLVLDHVEIVGKYQEQLFMSYVVYDSTMDFYYYENAAGTICQSYNTDYQIAPDPGSVNPWIDDSDGYDDTYTVRFEFDPQGTECSGGGPGQNASAGTNFNVLPLSRTGSGYGPTTESPRLIQGDFFGAAADSKVPRASNGCAYVGADLTPCTTPHMFAAPTAAAQSSVWSNPVAGYLATAWVAAPGFVYVYRGRAPRVPEGASPVPWNDNQPADYDMRYFSLCVDKKVWPFPAQDANWSCANGSFGSGVYDPATNPDGLTKLAVGDDGYWTVLVSSDDLTDNPQVGDATVLKVAPGEPVAFILRHMVVADGFNSAVTNVDRDGAWTTAYDTLGEYYPVETVVCNKGQFDARGWTDGGCFVPPVTGG